jgi:hypothetical protein
MRAAEGSDRRQDPADREEDLVQVVRFSDDLSASADSMNWFSASLLVVDDPAKTSDDHADLLANTRHRQRRQRNSSNSWLATTHCRLDADPHPSQGSGAARPRQSVNRRPPRAPRRRSMPCRRSGSKLTVKAARDMIVGL